MILVASTPAAGHVKPMLALASHLKKCGHQVLFTTSSNFRHEVESQGLAFTPLIGTADFDFENNNLMVERMKFEPGPPQLNHDLKHIFGDVIPDQYRSLRHIMARENVDLILVDAFFLGALAYIQAPQKSRVPVVSCGVFGLMMQTEEVSPFAGVDRTPAGRQRNIEHNRQQAADLAPAMDYLNDVMRSCGSAPFPGFIFNDAYTLPDLLLQFGTREFEYGLEKLPPNMQLVGPVLPARHVHLEVPDWLRNLDETKPIIFLTQGTVANYDFDQLVNPALEALATEDVTVVCTAGGRETSAIKLQPNAIVEKYVPYEFILPRAAVFITNAGYNGVQQALSWGVPVVAAGASEDKPFVAARLAWTGAGINLETGTPTPEQIRNAVRRILANGEFKKRALAMQESYARHDALNSLSLAVDKILESETISSAD
jgi:MGT family glycosyltransferase